MTEEIKRFERAFQAMKRASSALDVRVERSMRQRKTCASLINLVQRLPRGYYGTRKVYELIERTKVL